MTEVDGSPELSSMPSEASVMPSQPSASDPLFDKFWSAYPRKTDKKMARRQWMALRRHGVDLRMVIAAADRFRIECAARGTEKTFIAHPSTWLLKERYLGEEEGASPPPAIPASPAATPGRLNSEQLLVAVVRLAAEHERPLTAAREIIALVLRESPSAPVPEFAAISPERARELAVMDYPEYLRTPEWEARKRIMRTSAGHRCQVCSGADRLHVHHRTYDRRGNERPGDLTVLCEGCHDLFHANGKLVKEPAA